MAFVSIDNACAVEIRFTWHLQRTALTFGFTKSGGFDATALQVIADHMSDWWATFARGRAHPTVVLRETYARALDSESAPSYVSTKNTGTTGGRGATAPMPSNTALCISFRSGQRGRANRGRNYYFGLTIGDMQSNTTQLSAANAEQIRLYYEALLPGGAWDPTPARWVVLSRQLNGVVIGRAVPITSVTVVDTVIDSQRRRLPGRGL